MQMLETLLVGQEFVNAAKRAGVYGDVLQWMAAQRRGEFAIWPGIRTVPMPSVQTFPVKMTRENALTTVAAPKRALDALHEAYAMLEIDDTKPLTQDSLKSAYRKVASKHHPDRGGSTQAFDKITRSFKYLEEVLNKLVPSNNGSSIPFTQSMHSVAAAPSLTVPRLHGAVTHPPAQVQLAVHQQQQQQQQHPHQPPPPPISLNPKNLNMTVFNQLFEENRLPDPDEDGYGDWLKSNNHSISTKDNDKLRSKFNVEMFNNMFVEQGKREQEGYVAPSEITHSAGTELGRGRPAQYTSAIGSRGVNYTDLKYAYGEGSTFSQDVANVQTGKQRTFDDLKRERESAPVPLTQEEMVALEAIEAQKKQGEAERLRRLTARDQEVESVHSKLQSRLKIQS